MKALVGPRPPLPREIPEYSEREFRRLTVKPGLTGPWQVSGRSDLSFHDMVELDLDYIKKRSFLYDLKLIARTVKVVFTGEGAARAQGRLHRRLQRGFPAATAATRPLWTS